MTTAMLDERGRITLGTKIADRYGKKFVIIEAEKDIVLVPISKDPLAELRRIGREAGIDKYTIKELKQMAREEAEKEIQEKLERLKKNARR